jgi:two-component system, OmpR family, response regulator CpxR
MPKLQQILILSDSVLDEFMRAALEQQGFGVTVAHDAEKAYGQLLGSSFDLVIVDVARTQKGVEFVKRLRSEPKLSRTRVLTIAAWGTGQATLALTEGADAFEAKPLNPDRLVVAVERLLRPKAVRTAVASNLIGRIETH